MVHQYRISFRIGDSSFEIESTDLKWLEKKEKDFFTKFTEKPRHPAKVQEHVSSYAPQALPQNLTINEFYKKYIKSKNIGSRPDIAVFFIYYLEKILKRDSIKTADVTQCFADVAYPNYNKLNITDILSQGKRKAFLNNVNNNWSLTITGEDFIINRMTKEDS